MINELLAEIQWTATKHDARIAAVKASPAALARFCALIPKDEVKKHTLVDLGQAMAASLHPVPLTSGLYD